MTTATVGGTGSGGRTAPPGGPKAAGGMRRPWARPLWAWLTSRGYRPEWHYMRGGRQGVGMPPLLQPA